MGSPYRKCWNRTRACAGRCWGTACPAPRTVTKVRPSYSMLQPPTYHHSICTWPWLRETVTNSLLHSERNTKLGGVSPVLNNTDLGWDHVPGVPAGLDRKAQGGKRAPGRGQRHHSVRVTTANEKRKKHACVHFLAQDRNLLKKLSTLAKCLYNQQSLLLPEDPHLEASSDVVPVHKLRELRNKVTCIYSWGF